MAVTARSSTERLLATAPVEERTPAVDPATGAHGRVETATAPLATHPLPAVFRPGSPLPWPPPQAAPIPTATAPLPPAPLAPATVTRPVVIDVPSPPVRRRPRCAEADQRPPDARAVVPRSRGPALAWLMIALTAAFFGMVAAALTRWWMG
ncbi:hypothetical protein [Sorangium sp. So ce1151]|uniref:hypothetical protein n=1 Tax=Sorangium sp. So ce1151 TaxID=3133332 RepID=UPI003F6424AA